MATDQSPLPVFLTTKQVAGIIGVSTHYVQDLIKSQKGPPVYRIGPRYRFRKQEVLEWLESKRR